MEENRKTGIRGKKAILFFSILLLLSILVTIPALSWFYKNSLVAYAPVSNNEFLYIGAGHIAIDPLTEDFEEDAKLEDVRYLYLEGIDATDGKEYEDFVFCVYGKSVSGFLLQLAYTTNNQFSYSIYNAAESSVSSAGAVKYTTHGETPGTYYYTASGEALPGTYLNKTVVAGETLADSSKHMATYGSYNTVNKYAEPIYWQTNDAQRGKSNGAFVSYFILRVWKGEKNINDRETDVICFAAKSSSYSEPEP